jgi:hypothetical protein
LLFSFNFNFAERVIYQEIKKWSVKNDHYIVTHFHDWSTFADKKREKVVYVLQNPFSQEENDYAYIECRVCIITSFETELITLLRLIFNNISNFKRPFNPFYKPKNNH